MLKFFMSSIALLSLYCSGMELCTTIEYSDALSRNEESEILLSVNVSKTVTTLGFFYYKDEKIFLLLELETKTTNITDFVQFIATILDDIEKRYSTMIKRACFGVPGNPSAQKNFIQPFNISFAVDADALRIKTKLEQIVVVNDFEVIGYGIDVLNSNSVIQINRGSRRDLSPKLIIGAGNGLGSCFMVWNEPRSEYIPYPLGFCYADFAPHTASEIELVDFIKCTSEMKNVSWGYLLGIKGGIKKMYEFLGFKREYAESFVDYAVPQEIFDHAQLNERCRDAVNLYMHLYIRLIRNAAYTLLPYGGLYIVNQIVEKNSELFTQNSFFDEFLRCNNDLLSAIIKDIPIYIVVEPKVKLYGAVQYLLRA